LTDIIKSQWYYPLVMRIGHRFMAPLFDFGHADVGDREQESGQPKQDDKKRPVLGSEPSGAVVRISWPTKQGGRGVLDRVRRHRARSVR
jgi:hypothetical protein